MYLLIYHPRFIKVFNIPLVCDEIDIVVVVFPPVSLREDLNHLTGFGVSAVNISSKGEVDPPSIESGSYWLVFGSPGACIVRT